MIYSSLSTNWRFPHWFAIAHVLNSYTQCVYFLTLFCLLIFLFVFGPLLYMLALNVSNALNCSYCSSFMKFFFIPLQYSCLENPMDGGAWWAAVHGVASSRTRLSNFTFTFHFHALEKEMATQSSVLAWRIPGKGEPGGLPSLGPHRIGHDWSDLAAAAAISYSIIF